MPSAARVQHTEVTGRKFITFCQEEKILHLAFLPKSYTTCKNFSNAK